MVSVTGTLVSRSGYLDAASGMLSYADISDAVCEALDDASVHGVVLDLDSPGGEVGGLFDLIEAIRAAKEASGKPLWSVANEGALSAAYALASVADRIYVTRTGEVGSVGVVAVHIDESAADAQAGLAWTYMFAGATKVDGNPHQPLSDRARAVIQADVDELYAELCALVATNRRMSVEAVRGTEAAVYRGEAAVRMGFADRIGTLDQAIAEMAAGLETSAADPTELDHKKEHVHGDERDRTAGTGCKRATAATGNRARSTAGACRTGSFSSACRGTGSRRSAAGRASSSGERG